MEPILRPWQNDGRKVTQVFRQQMAHVRVSALSALVPRKQMTFWYFQILLNCTETAGGYLWGGASDDLEHWQLTLQVLASMNSDNSSPVVSA